MKLYKLYNPKVDLVNDNMYTKFGLIPSIRSQSIRSQDIERKPNYDGEAILIHIHNI